MNQAVAFRAPGGNRDVPSSVLFASGKEGAR